MIDPLRSNQGGIYSVFARNGHPVAKDVSIEELKRIDATAFRLLETGIARQDIVFDASLRSERLPIGTSLPLDEIGFPR